MLLIVISYTRMNKIRTMAHIQRDNKLMVLWWQDNNVHVEDQKFNP